VICTDVRCWFAADGALRFRERRDSRDSAAASQHDLVRNEGREHRPLKRAHVIPGEDDFEGRTEEEIESAHEVGGGGWNEGDVVGGGAEEIVGGFFVERVARYAGEADEVRELDGIAGGEGAVAGFAGADEESRGVRGG